MRSRAREELDRRAAGAVDPALEVDIGDAGDGEAVQLGRQTGNGNVVPRDLDGGGLDEEPIAQGSGSQGAGGPDEKSAAGEGNRHRGKLTGASPLRFSARKPLNPIGP